MQRRGAGATCPDSRRLGGEVVVVSPSPRIPLLRAVSLAPFALLLACADAAPDAREATPRTDCSGKCDAIDGGMSALPAAVDSLTWDGYVVLGVPEGGSTCQAMAVRPQRFQATVGAIDVPPAAFSTGVACPSDLDAHALVADPAFETNPYPSDAAGAPAADGAFSTYRALVYTSATDEALPQLTVRAAQIVVASPRSAEAEVTSMQWAGDAQALTDTSGAPLLGVSPTLTADGGLMIFGGDPGRATDDDGRLRTDALVYARRTDAGWTTPQALTRLVTERDTLVDGARLGARYPLAQEGLRVPDGRMYPFGLPFRGANPWVSRDGTELFFTAVTAGPEDDAGQRERVGALSVVGRDTGHTIRHIDGAVNPSREGLDGPAMLRRRHVSPGQTPGFWTPYADTTDVMSRDSRPSYPLFGTIGDADAPIGTYNEVDFGAYADRDYLLYLPMNEMLVPVSGTELGYATDRTADISGALQTATLDNGARFAVEQFGLDEDDLPVRDENTGAHGRAVYFSETGRVHVEAGWPLRNPGAEISVEAFVQRLESLEGDAADRSFPIVRWPGVAELTLGEDGVVASTVFTGGQARSSGPVGDPLPINGWVHVAMTFDGYAGTVRTYRDGELVAENVFDPAYYSGPVGDVVIGPDGAAGSSLFDDTVAVVAIDEVAVSRVVRTDAEIARAAGLPPEVETDDFDNASLLDVTSLPLGLDAAELEVPATNPTTEDAVELGRMLFFDPRLSANGEISCATCHDPAHGWSDGMSTGFGINDQPLGRNSPTILNRAFSTQQFWEGRAPTLEIQAIGPILSPVEMGSSVAQLEAFLRSVPEYVERFEAVYGEGPRAERVADAIASFERTVLSGDSAVDRFLAGDTSALDASEQRGMALFNGRARCSQCHSGSNFTDESFHNSGLIDAEADDTGRYSVTHRRADLHAYKTPTLRSIADTGPYFHDGSVETLAEVVALYNAGSQQAEHDRDIRPLDLTPAQEADLVAFLEALRDPTALQMEAPELPESPPQQ
jgi:cytochrome c peroxidase